VIPETASTYLMLSSSSSALPEGVGVKSQAGTPLTTSRSHDLSLGQRIEMHMYIDFQGDSVAETATRDQHAIDARTSASQIHFPSNFPLSFPFGTYRFLPLEGFDLSLDVIPRQPSICGTHSIIRAACSGGLDMP